MAEDSQHSKTEAATPRRREESRKKGQTAYSTDLSNAVLLLVGFLFLWFGGAAVGQAAIDSVKSGISSIAEFHREQASVVTLARDATSQFVAMVGAISGLVFVSALGMGLFQSGFRVSFEPLRPNLDRLSLAKGWSRLFSQRGAVRGAGTIVRLLGISLVAFWIVTVHEREISRAGNQSLFAAAGIAWTIAMKTAITVALVLVLLGLVDYLYQRWKHEQDLRMSRRDLQDENRRDEGDPQIKNRQKRLRREAAHASMLRDVPGATVVIINPTHFAVALRYERGRMSAPRVVAKGQNNMARRIIKLAEKNRVPVLQRKPLARALYHSVKVGQEIPAELYQAVAEIIAFILGLRPMAGR